MSANQGGRAATRARGRAQAPTATTQARPGQQARPVQTGPQIQRGAGQQPPRPPQGVPPQSRGPAQSSQPPMPTTQGAWGKPQFSAPTSTAQPPPRPQQAQQAQRPQYEGAETRPRAGHRGGQRGEQRSDEKELPQQMSKMALGERHTDVVKYVAPPAGLKQGKGGEDVDIETNYFELVTRPNWHVYQYHLEYQPQVDSPFLRKIFLKDHRETLGNFYVFDGMSDLKSMFKLPDAVTTLYSTDRKTNGQIAITFKFTNELSSNHPEIKRLYNTQMKRNLDYMGYERLNREHFDLSSGQTIPRYNLELLTGVRTPIGEHDSGILMSVDTIFKYLRTDSALSIITRAKENSNEGTFRGRPSESRYAITASSELVGQIVMTRYNNRTYKIEEIAWDITPKHTFTNKKGEQIPYIDYYQNQYNLKINDLNQPLLICESKDKEISADREKKLVNLVPELCIMTGLTDKMRTDTNMLRTLANYTRMDPEARVKSLNTFMGKLQNCPQAREQMDKWNLSFSKQLLRIRGRALESEAITQGRGQSYKMNLGDEDFSRNMRDKQLVDPKPFTNWAIVHSTYDQAVAQDFLAKLQRVAPPMGIEYRPPQIIVVNNDRPNIVTEAIRSRCGNMSMVVVVLSTIKKDSYDAVKRLLCLDMGIPSQVVVARTLNNPKRIMSIATKVAIQMDVKLGATPWFLQIPSKKAIMVMGYDTYHDASNKSRSFGALVASMNPSFTRYYSQTVAHDNNSGSQELNTSIKVLSQIALKNYIQTNGALPQMVVYFRDGVGEGQFQHVLDLEIEGFKQAWKSIASPEQVLQLVVVIVTKRINTRFFRRKNQRYDNPVRGTIIDTGITKPDRFDFFLVSQSVNQGTVSPTSYLVLENSADLTANVIQRLTYKMTHLYFNWPGTISVPAPCQYAHKLAFLAGQSLHSNINQKLGDTLFYL